MSVFKNGITSFVILTAVSLGTEALGGAKASAGWLYQVDQPEAPNTVKRKELRNPTVAQIQKAIKPKTRVDIVGEVDASEGGRLDISANDVRLNFSRADKVRWSGADDWGGFLEISGQRVEVEGLSMGVQSGSGRCRGVVIHSPASDVRIVGCSFSNVADGLIADGNWERLAIEDTKFLRCSDWGPGDMDGGYGLFLEDDDDQPDHLRLSNVKVTLASNSGQHGMRISKVQRILLDDSMIRGNNKRSLWAYGVEHVSISGTTFEVGSVLFNLKTNEWQTDRPTRHIRMVNSTIDHRGQLTPLAIFCGKSTSDFRMKNVDIRSSSSNEAIEISWREDSGLGSSDITWSKGSVTFNGGSINGRECKISDEWSDGELKDLKIGP